MRRARAIECQICGRTVVTSSAVQKYCEPCSNEKNAERRRRWAKDNPLPVEKSREKSAAQRSRVIAAGLAINAMADRTIAWTADSEPDLAWLVRVAVPFSYAASKNHIYTMAGNHVGLRRESRAIKDAITLALKAALRGDTPVQGKVWIDIMVEKPNHRGDAINVVDLVCDAVKVAVGVDDRWFSIRRLDWRIVKNNPQLVIGVGQECIEPQQVCSHCGRSLDFSMFRKKKGALHGIDRACRDCLSTKTQSLPLMGRIS